MVPIQCGILSSFSSDLPHKSNARTTTIVLSSKDIENIQPIYLELVSNSDSNKMYNSLLESIQITPHTCPQQREREYILRAERSSNVSDNEPQKNTSQTNQHDVHKSNSSTTFMTSMPKKLLDNGFKQKQMRKSS